MAESRSSLAIVLRWRSYGESDKIATLLTQDFGKLTGIGKGAKNSRRRFANSLEPLARVRVHFRQRDEASLAFLESCDLIDAAAVEPIRFAYGSYLGELAERLTVEWNPVENVYNLLADALHELERGPATASFLRAYELQLLAAAGFEPQLDHCNRCGGALPGDQVSFSPALGTFWCATCAVNEEGLTMIDAGVIKRLASLRRLPLAHCRDSGLGEAAAPAALLTGQLLAIQLGRPLRSLRLIAQLEA